MDGDAVGPAYLEREAGLAVTDALVQVGQQRRGDPLALLIVVDGYVHHVPDGVVARADQVREQAALAAVGRAARGEANARLLGELEHEHRERPRRREDATLDRDHLWQVGIAEPSYLHGGSLIDWWLGGALGHIEGALAVPAASKASSASGRRR